MSAVSSWAASTRERVRLMQNSLIAVAQLAHAAEADPAATEMLLRPYREELDQLYEHDVPLARLADASDLLLHVRGPAASGPSPKVSVVARLLTQTRDQVTRLAKQFGGITSIRVPAALDMDFVGVASGSLFIGFAAASGTEDAALTRRAVDSITQVGSLIAQDAALSAIVQVLGDPAQRDMAVAAVRQLSPSGMLGISEIDIVGRNERPSASLTTDTRRHARQLMAQPPIPTKERVSFLGTVREVDLDASRFEIRNVSGHADDIRCAHELDEATVKQLVDRRVRVVGAPEVNARGEVRLLWVDEVEILE